MSSVFVQKVVVVGPGNIAGLAIVTDLKIGVTSVSAQLLSPDFNGSLIYDVVVVQDHHEQSDVDLNKLSSNWLSAQITLFGLMPKSAIVVVVSEVGHELNLDALGLVPHLSLGLMKLSFNRPWGLRGLNDIIMSVNVSVTLRNMVPVLPGNESGVDVSCLQVDKPGPDQLPDAFTIVVMLCPLEDLDDVQIVTSVTGQPDACLISSQTVTAIVLTVNGGTMTHLHSANQASVLDSIASLQIQFWQHECVTIQQNVVKSTGTTAEAANLGIGLNVCTLGANAGGKMGIVEIGGGWLNTVRPAVVVLVEDLQAVAVAVAENLGQVEASGNQAVVFTVCVATQVAS